MDTLAFLLPPFIASLILTGIHAYLGVHVVERVKKSLGGTGNRFHVITRKFWAETCAPRTLSPPARAAAPALIPNPARAAFQRRRRGS